ncbi:hypothetical protein FACS1894110_25840 [Spirochaetia bacterium]|nr:hypothetical protein FACS1894110_25840 [Spirochaetia bacterium]
MKNKFALPKIQLPKLSAKGKRALATALFALAATLPVAAAEKILILAGTLLEPTSTMVNGYSSKLYGIDRDGNPDTIEGTLLIADVERAAREFKAGDIIVYAQPEQAKNQGIHITSNAIVTKNGAVYASEYTITPAAKTVSQYFTYTR